MIKNHFIKGLQHIGIPTYDIEVSTHFYEVLGFHKIMESMNEEENLRVSFLKLNELIVELYESKNVLPRDGAINHIALDVDSIDSLYEFVCLLGTEFVTNGIQFLPFWNKGIRYFTIYGPNHEQIEFCEKIK